MGLHPRLGKQVRVTAAPGRTVLVSGINGGILCPVRGVRGLGNEFIFPSRIAGGRRRHMTASQEDLWDGRHKVSDARKGNVNESQRNMLCQTNDKGWVSLGKEHDYRVPGAGVANLRTVCQGQHLQEVHAYPELKNSY